MNKGNKREMKGRAELHGTLMNCANENKPIKKSMNVLAIINFSRLCRLDMKKKLLKCCLTTPTHFFSSAARARMKREKQPIKKLFNVSFFALGPVGRGGTFFVH